MRPNGIITLTTDFGLADSYVGTIKGVILGIAPDARIVDITHDINPQNTHQAAYIIQTFPGYFPPGAIHMVIIDPTVGSERRAIAFGTPDAIFVAPDNGVLTYVWRAALERWGPEACRVVELAEPRFWLPHVSSTFHGRDIFAPVVAHLARWMHLAHACRGCWKPTWSNPPMGAQAAWSGGLSMSITSATASPISHPNIWSNMGWASRSWFKLSISASPASAKLFQMCR
jgi:S-adenosylmethionine hydrolase